MRRHHILPTLTLLVALATAASGHEPIKDEPIKLVVTLVEVRSSARCHGLDCPPWSIPRDTDFCFQAEGKYYAAISRPWGLPWAANGKKLIALQGQSIEISVADKEIVATASGTKVHLRRVHDDPFFKLEGCKHN